TIAIVLLPGPNSLYVLATTSQLGWRAGAWASFGIVVGDSLLMAAIVLGAASLLQNSPTLFIALRWLGAIYLLWLAWGLMRTAWYRFQKSVPQSGAQVGSIRFLQMHPFVAALALSLTNPKAIFFFISFFTQFVDPQFANPAIGPVWPQVLALGVLFITTGFFITAAYGAAAGIFGQALGRAAQWLGKISAVVFAGLAARLVLD
ncbi:MAG: leucine efflux protein LeuE, partial [Rhodobacteraceae bacterium]|nr:leucine efflux protein LeuE [Paracoccaceae bacterium]